MFEDAAPGVTARDVAAFSAGLQTLAAGATCAGGDDTAGASATGTGLGTGTGLSTGAGLVEQIRVLEELKSAVAAAQARVTARFAAAQRAAQRAAGMPAREVGKGVAAQVGLARRDSPVAGSRHLGLAEALVGEMPHTLAALAAGEISEWRATLVVRETACLSRADRGQVDAELAARPGGLAAMGNHAIATDTRRIGYRLDPHAVTDRARRAESDRRVTLRPAPDTMSWLTGLLPARQGVACYAALTRHADAQRAGGDPRSRGQVMADTLVERVTGQATADGVGVEVQLLLTDQTLLGDHPEPADLAGYGPLPAPQVRDWLRDHLASTDPTITDPATEHAPTEQVVTERATTDPATTGPAVPERAGGDPAIADPAAVERARVWLRRLYTHPSTGALVAMDSSRRCFDGGLRRLLIIRDRRCRTPWCDAPIRHADHARPAADRGPTTAGNGQGLCEACNYTKQNPGWTTRPGLDGTVHTITPTRHTYPSRPPPTPGRPPPTRPPPVPPPPPPSAVETWFRDLLAG